MKPKKPSAADRTVSLFAAPQELPIEVVEETEKDAERVPLEEDVDRMREVAFRGQEWTSKHFADKDATSNEYRLSFKGGFYYLETLHRLPDGKSVHGYSGLMIRESDLFNLTRVLVEAVREKQKKDAK